MWSRLYVSGEGRQRTTVHTPTHKPLTIKYKHTTPHHDTTPNQVDYEELEGRTFLPVPGHTKKEKYEFGTLTSFAYKVRA